MKALIRQGRGNFSGSTTADQARVRARQLNAQINLKRHEERRHKFDAEAKALEEQCTAFLPNIYREQFEQRYFGAGRIRRANANKEVSHWRTAQRIILDLQLDPSDWYDEAHLFYDWFFTRKLSFSYVSKVLRLLNLWGFFLSRKLGRPFMSIPRPRGLEKSRLLEAYFSKRGAGGNQSDPLRPEQLEYAKERLLPDQYNWLFLSVWLGLRPLEIDQLKEPEKVRVMRQTDGSAVLWVYQTKLTSVPPRFRWKLIPIFLTEQRRALTILESRDFRRPMAKTVKRLFGVHTTLYGGRKGFADLMLAHGQDFINISQWMGHSTLQRTWGSYKCRTQEHHTEPAA